MKQSFNVIIIQFLSCDLKLHEHFIEENDLRT